MPSPQRLGQQLLRGLPFLLADNAQRFCVVPSAAPRPVRIRIGRSARCVIVLHRQLEGPLTGTSAVGCHVADYIFHLEGGESVRVPIRQRFEVDVVPVDWGIVPFLALPDQDDTLHARESGPYELAGLRQCEAVQGVPCEYYLWAWQNPGPDQRIDEIELAPGAYPVAIAAITLGHAEERPLVRDPRRPVVIDVDGGAAEVGLHIDRGVTSYVQRVPDPSEEGLDVPGWGHWAGRRYYAEVAALPSASAHVSVNGHGFENFSWADLVGRNTVSSGPAHVRLADPGRNWVHVKVLDEATQRKVHCRVRFCSDLGVPFQPHGHHNHVNSNLGTWHSDVGGDVRLGDVTYAYIDGSCQGWLPRGDVVVEIARGFEYRPVREVVRIEPGQRELTLEITRLLDMAKLGWYSGDSHVHFLSTQGAHLEQQCEDLHVVNLLQSQWGSLFTNTEDFTGRVSKTPDGHYLTYVGQENRQHLLGHLVLWGLKEPVMPWCSAGPSEAEIGGSLETTVADWADRAHSQGGTVVIPHFPFPNGEPAVLVATGRADAVESIAWGYPQQEAYYSYLNCGFKLPLVGGTDKMSSEVPVGLYRTYAKLDEEFSYDAWCAAVRAGRTFVSGGPIIQLSVEGREIGDTVELSGAGTLQVSAWAESIFPLSTLDIVVNGQVVASTGNAQPGGQRLSLNEPIAITGHSWVAARCWGATGAHLDVWQRPVYAHTSPVYVPIGGQWEPRDEECARYLVTLVQGGLEYVRHNASYYDPSTVTHHHGQDDHLRYMEAPFLQALASLERRRGRTAHS